MATGSLVSVQEYLNTSYRPDCDYVGGVLLERNVGEYDHGRLQLAVGAYYLARGREWGVRAVTEQRVQIAPDHYRVPDVCVTTDLNPPQIFAVPPFICIEVLSKDDRLADSSRRAREYLEFGVPYVWILDPATRRAFRCTLHGLTEVSELRTENPETVVPLSELFD